MCITIPSFPGKGVIIFFFFLINNNFSIIFRKSTKISERNSKEMETGLGN